MKPKTPFYGHKSVQWGNKMRSESILMRTEKAGGQARRKLRPNVTFLHSEQASKGERNRTTRKKS